MQQRKLSGLRAQAFEHPLDSRALNALKNTAGFDKLLAKVNEWGLERILRVQLTGSYLRVTADNFPEVHETLTRACDILDIASPPELYIAAGGDVNAFTAGTTRPLIVVNSSAIDALDDAELLFIIAHELGHIMCGHALYYQIAEFLPVIARVIGSATFGLGDIVGLGVQAALLHWRRMSELSCDRAGLLACQDANAAITAMIKIAGLPQKYYDRINPEDFINQAKAFQEMESDRLTRYAKYITTIGSTHPWTVARAHQFLNWVDSGEYKRVFSEPQKVPVALPAGIKSYCTHCGGALSGAEVYCPCCGQKLSSDTLSGK